METTEKQGHVGNLSKKTREELQELLQRQQKIFKNVKFANSLPDKGEKIKYMIKKIEDELQSRMDVDSTADLLHRMALSAEKAKQENNDLFPKNEADIIEKQEENVDPLREVINRATDEKQILDERPHPFVNSYERVIKRAEQKNKAKKKFYPNKTVKTEHVDELSDKLKNISMTKVDKKDVVSLDEPPPLESPPLSSSEKFAFVLDSPKSDLRTCVSDGKSGTGSSPGRLIDLKVLSSTESTVTDSTVCAGDICENTDGNEQNSSAVMSEQNAELGDHNFSGNQKNSADKDRGTRSLKYMYDESLEKSTYGPPKKYENAKLISVEESVRLMQLQKQKQEALQAQQAADRLAQKLGIKMADFEPKDLQMRYRDQAEKESDEESCESEGELDYPD